MVTLTDAEIAARKAELLKLIDKSRRDIETAEVELSDIAGVERQMKRVAGQQPLPLESRPREIPPPVPDVPPPEPIAQVRFAGLTQAIRTILETPEKTWWTANEIQEVATELKGKPVPMSSISPKLTELKNSGIIRRDDKLVALASRVEADGGL